MPVPATSPAELIARCISGDDGARAQFYGEYADVVRRAVLRTLRRYSADESVVAEADDLVSEVYTKLFANECAMLERVRNGRSIHAWLIALTRNHVIDHLRRLSARGRATSALEQAVPAAHVPSHGAAAISGEHAEVVRSAVESLDPGDRLALELYFMQGLTYAEVADILHANVNTVSARVRRAKGKLRHVLEERGIYEP